VDIVRYRTETCASRDTSAATFARRNPRSDLRGPCWTSDACLLEAVGNYWRSLSITSGAVVTESTGTGASVMRFLFKSRVTRTGWDAEGVGTAARC
jgi:hypothetical protein